MRKKIKKWAIRFTAFALFIAGILLIIVLNPLLTYANKTMHNNYSIYYNKALDPSLTTRLDEATALLKTSELYDNDLKLDICLNDGSFYTAIIKTIRGPAFAWGFYNKVVLQGTMNCSKNYDELNGYKWNLTQLFTHEMIHCLQFHKLGLWRSKPFANIPSWKWEGYAEYIARQNSDQKDLLKNIDRFLKNNKENWAIAFADNTISPREYYAYWILMQYCMNIKKMNYNQVLDNSTKEETIKSEMMKWYIQQTNRISNQ